MNARKAFAQRLRGRTPMIGTFVKLRDPAVIEILGGLGFDFVVIDAEHAPFDRESIACSTLAARAANLAALVRIPCIEGQWISTSLDCGAAGIVVPQVRSAAMAAELVRKFSYRDGARGFSPSTAAAGYGARGIAGHLEAQAEETVLICQIEDRAAVGEAGDIAATDGVDGLLVGPVDLAVSEGGTDPGASDIMAMGEQVMGAARTIGVSGGMFVSDTSACSRWSHCGATLFVLGTDQSFLQQSARAGLAIARQATQ
ncbi:MAG: aldolase/citrate lyase family protein [Hoeflea sp.]|uniref:HpcH/HpaI aldolase family protein n=1 Tax=Hoeflea sp. TaxID=1940281 RepID=UPI0032EC4535